MQHTALLLIEFQQEWLSERGKLHHLFADKEQFLSSLANAKQALDATRTTPVSIIHSGLKFSTDYKELGLAQYGLRAAIASHQTFLADSVASEFAPDFKPLDSEFVVTGRVGSSAFAGSNLDIYLRNNHIHTLYLMGYALHVCVESTLRAAHDLGYEVILLEDACAAFTRAQKNYVLNEIVHHFGSSIKTHEYLEIIRG